MRKQKGFTLIELAWVVVAGLLIAMFATWVLNVVKLTECDFEPNYECEVIHGIGLVPMVSVVTVWFDTDKKEN